VFGTLSFTPNLGYWIYSSHRVEFQNQSTAWIIEGEYFVISGGGWNQGGIDGNGQPWMSRAADHSNQYGRPISLFLWKSRNATVKDSSFRQPQFWSVYLQGSYDVKLTGLYINGTNTDPAGNSSNYETDIDGLDSIRVDGLEVSDWVFHGGDDCLAPKCNSTNMVFRNLTCVGGGIAFDSIGQYPDMPDYIANVTASNITVRQDVDPEYGEATGRVWNVTFSDLQVDNVTQAVYVNKCYYKVADQANYCDTCTLHFEDMYFSDVYGLFRSQYGASLNWSARAPCRDMNFSNLDLRMENGTAAGAYCDNVDSSTGIICSG
jgi:galacturan 1,4-alpha-galacturonidase